MPHMDRTGPTGKGSGTGRKLGKCQKNSEKPLEDMGKGMGLKRKSGGGEGKGQRLKSSKLFDNQNKIKDEDCDSNKK